MANHVQISHDLYKWLVQYQVVPNNQKYKASGNFELEYRIQQQLECGFLVAKLLTSLATQKSITLNGQLMSTIKNSNTPAAKVYNWNILNQSALKLGVSLSKEKQKEVTSGNFDSLVHILLEIQNKTNPKKIQKSSISSAQSQQIGIDIKKVRKYQEIGESQNLLQFIIILISKYLSLTAKQAVATLAQSAKYLAHMIVKGIKNSFQQIIQFIEDATRKMDKIMYLTERDPQKNIQFLLQVFKPTLISREVEVAKAGTSLFKALHYESFKYNSKNIVYQILSKEGEGFDFIYMGLKRHPSLNYEIFDSLHILIQGIMKDFFEIQLRKTINNEQQIIRTIILLMQPLLQNKQAKQEVYDSGLFTIWQKNYDNITTAKLKGKDMTAINEQTKLLHIELMYTLFIGYYKQLEPRQAEEMLMKLTEQLKKNTRSEIYTIRIPSLLKIFDILDFLATHKNKLAALLYKKLIFLFVQNHSQDEMRQIVLQNLTIIIGKFPTIPLQFLLQPMLKQLTNKQGTSYILNLFDFQFILQLCKHPKMQEYYAITFLNYFIKLYTKSVIYSSLIFRIIQAITDRFCESEQIRQYCLRSTDSSLNVYGMLVMGKSKGNKANYNHEKGMSKQQIIINNQKKSLIIELIKHFIKLQHKELTEQIKTRILTLFVDWYENRNYYDKGLAAILVQLGDVEDMVIQFKEMKQKQAKSKTQREKQNKDNQHQSANSNQFNADVALSRLSDNKGLDRSQIQNKQFKYYDYDLSDRGSPLLQDIGLGYKKKKNLPNKYQVLPNRSIISKPDPKLLEDIQKIKQKWKLEQSRAKLDNQQKKTTRLNEKQLLQRNLSLGYTKLPQLTNDQILFEFDSVKRKHLKDTLDLIDLEIEQQRQKKSFQNILQRYQPYIKRLFSNYSGKSGINSQYNAKQSKMLSFTQIMRFLKQKMLLAKIPKIAINQIISTINQKRKKQKNILGGIYQQDFPTFILYYTDLIMQQDLNNKKDEPFGLKAEKIIMKMLQGENNVKELFDPKIQKIKQDLDYDQNTPIPQQYKKVKQNQTELSYLINIRDHINVDSSFLACYQLLDGLVYEAVGVHIVSPFTQYKQKFAIVKINKSPVVKIIQSQSMDRKISRPGTEAAQNDNTIIGKKNTLNDSSNSFTKPLKKQAKNFIKKKSQSQSHHALKKQPDSQELTQIDQRQKKRELHAKRLKQQILKMRQQKQKLQEFKKQEEKIVQEKLKKKEEERKQYLQQNKKKLKQKKQQQQLKLKQNLKAQQQKKQKRKAQVKSKEAQLVQKQKKLIQQKREKIVQKLKQKQLQDKQRDKFNKIKPNDKLLNEMKVSAADQRMKDLLIKNSIENGQIKQIIQKNRKNFDDLFQAYWNWQKQKMQLKNLAQIFKDFQTIKYISPKDIADVYKSVSKGQLISLQSFIECVVKLAYRSTAIQQETKNKLNQAEIERNKIQQSNQNPKLSIEPFKFMLQLLKMTEQNYKQIVIKVRNEKQLK